MANPPNTQTPAPQAPPPAPPAKPAGPPIFKFDPGAPFRQMYKFATGTIGGALDGLSGNGARGTYAGLGIGLVCAIMMPAVSSIGLILGGGLAGMFAGMALGAVWGGITGGATRAARAQARADARELAAQRAQRVSVNRGAVRDRVADDNFDRTLQYNQEQQSFWRDHVSAQGQGHGRGF